MRFLTNNYLTGGNVHMKKMIRWEGAGLEISFSGVSTKNGIFMRVEKEDIESDDNFSKILPSLYPGAFARIAEDGKIIIDPEIREYEEVEESARDETRFKKIFRLKLGLLISSIACFILSFICIFSENEYVPTFMVAMAFILYACSKLSSDIYCFAKLLMKDAKITQCFKFHAAEHAAINAYYDLKKVPTLSEIKDYSSFSYRCGVARGFKEAWVPLGIGICRLAPGNWYFLALIFLCLFSLWASKRNFYFVEIISLVKPTDYEYDAEIKCMSEAIKRKEMMDNILEKGIPEIFMIFSNDELPILQIMIGGNPKNTKK